MVFCRFSLEVWPYYYLIATSPPPLTPYRKEEVYTIPVSLFLLSIQKPSLPMVLTALFNITREYVRFSLFNILSPSFSSLLLFLFQFVYVPLSSRFISFFQFSFFLAFFFYVCIVQLCNVRNARLIISSRTNTIPLVSPSALLQEVTNSIAKLYSVSIRIND